MKISWDEILSSNVEEILLVWYGSILNVLWNEGDSVHHNTVLVEWFRREYRLKMVPENYPREKIEVFMKKYWTKYGITSMQHVDALDPKLCVLTAVPTNNNTDIINGVLIKIPRSDFETYKMREEIYDLYEVDMNCIDPHTWIIQDKVLRGYILVAQEEYCIDDGHAFLPYHEYSRQWAYNFWEYFWKMFDETTYKIHP